MLYFPHPLTVDGEGLLAVGGDLSVQRLILAYSHGIFPWFNQDPILWWFTHPRCVLKPNHIKVSKSMRQLLRKNKSWKISINRNFEFIIESCARTRRNGQIGTWITPEMEDAYLNLRNHNLAHSVEVWENNKIIAGLYGVCIGRIFFGESMFTKVSNASKFALIQFSRYLSYLGCNLIDCQQVTDHMLSLGATTFTKEEFYHHIKINLTHKNLPIHQESFELWLDSRDQPVNL